MQIGIIRVLSNVDGIKTGFSRCCVKNCCHFCCYAYIVVVTSKFAALVFFSTIFNEATGNEPKIKEEKASNHHHMDTEKKTFVDTLIARKNFSQCF